jgi:hypothetical protein
MFRSLILKIKTDCCKVKAGKDNIENLQLELPELVCFSPSIPFILEKGMEQVYYFEVTPPTQPAEAIAKVLLL